MKKSIFLVSFAVFVLFAVGIPCNAATETEQVSSGTQSAQFTGEINLEKISDDSETGGTYVLNQENTYTGTTTVTAGTLELTHAKGASTGTINVGKDGILKLTLNDGSATKNAIPNAVMGTGQLQTSTTGVFTLSNNLSGFAGTIQDVNGYLVFRTADVKQATLKMDGHEVCFVDFQTATGADTTLGMISGWGTLRPSNQIVTETRQIWLAVGSIANASGTFSGTIRDQADGVSGKTFYMGIEKVGATSTWKLTGESNSYTLGTKITEGVLEVSNSKQHPENADWTSNALGTGTVTLNGGTLRLSSANMVIPNALNVAAESSVDSTIANAMTLSGKLTGSAKLNFTSSTGQRTSITYNGDGSAFTGTIVIQGSTNSDGGFLTLGESASDFSKALVTLSPTSGSTGNLCFLSSQDTTFKVGMLTGTGQVRPNAHVTSGSVQTLQVGARTTDTDHTFSGTLSDYVNDSKELVGKLAVEKVGTGTWTLSNSANAYSGGTKITKGTLEISAAALGTGTVTLNGGTLKTVTNDVSLTNAVAVTADSKIDVATVTDAQTSTVTKKTLSLSSLPTTTNSSTIELTGGILSLSAADSSTSSVGWKLNGGTLQIASGNNLNLSKPLNVVSASTLDVNVGADEFFGGLTGSADLTISSTGNQRAVVHFTGDVSAYTGTVKMTTNNTFFVLEDGSKNMSSATLNLATGSNFFFRTAKTDKQTFQIGMLTGSGTVKAYTTTPQTAVCTVQVGNAKNYTNHTFSGSLQDRDGKVLAVEKVGSNTWTLSGWSNYSGGMTVTGGTLEVNHVNALGNGTLTLNGGKIQFFTPGYDVTYSNPINVTADSIIAVNHQNHVKFSGALSGTEDINYTSTSRAVVWFQGDTSNYTGTIKLATAREYFVVLDSTAKNSSTVAFDVAAGSYLSVNALNSPAVTDCSLGMLTGSGNFRHYYNAAAGNVALQVGNDTEYTNHTWSGKIFDHNSGFNQTVSLTKAGSNTWTIAGENTYTGSTTVAGGVLELTSTGNLSKTSGVTVLSGAKLLNAGTIAGKVTVEQDGVYEATSSTASTGGLTFKDGGIVQSMIAENEKVIPVDLTSATLLGDFTTQILFEGENPEDLWEQSFKIIQANDESILGKLNVSSLVSGTTFLPSFADGYVSVTAYSNNAVPEPATWVLLLIGVGFFIRRVVVPATPISA